MKKRIIKHQHGTPNPIISEEEETMIAVVKKALNSTSNAQTIGRNGEILLRDFLNRYLPYTLRAATGHFVPPSGELSPQIDVMVLDARYPLLSHNSDGSVLAMLHSVIATIEVKTRITTRDIPKMWSDAIKIMTLAKEVKGYSTDKWGSLNTLGFAYGCANRLDALEDQYQKNGRPELASLDISFMRLHQKDATRSQPLGVELHFEPVVDNKSSKIKSYFFMSVPKFTPLSDLHYSLVQDSYYTLGARDFSYSDIGAHVMKYMSWSTCPWQEYYAMKQKELEGI